MSYVVEIDDVWLSYPMKKDKPGFKEFIVNLPKFTKKTGDSYFWALKGINLHVKGGECIGIIGKNGAGKSSLLSLIIGTVYPTRGTVKTSHRITPLLSLGAGFHPDLTGKENILLNGVILGHTKEEVMERMEDIIAFSEIGEFIDMPVRTYSSGMYLRIAFSVAIHTEPGLLLIDEILEVGDEAFKKKSKNAIVKLIKGGVATILVSHNLCLIEELCSSAVWLDRGEINTSGKPVDVVKEYRNMQL